MAKGDKKKPGKKTAAKTSAAKAKKSSKKQKLAEPQVKSHRHARLPGSLILSSQALSTMTSFWRPIGGIFLVYLLLNLVFANGLSVISSNISMLSEGTRSSNPFSQALADFSALAGGSGWSSSESSSSLQSILFIITSLAFIWALRQLSSGEKVTVKQAYYLGMSPFIPFILLLLVIILQLLPIAIGAALLGIVSTGAFGPVVIVVFSLIFLLLTTWSLYMLSSSVVALYIVTLPHMQPRQALRSAKNLVKGRRWSVMRRLIFLPFLLLVVMACVFIPLLLIVPPLAAPLFFGAASLAVLAGHTYLYNLYRRLLEHE